MCSLQKAGQGHGTMKLCGQKEAQITGLGHGLILCLPLGVGKITHESNTKK